MSRETIDVLIVDRDDLTGRAIARVLEEEQDLRVARVETDPAASPAERGGEEVGVVLLSAAGRRREALELTRRMRRKEAAAYLAMAPQR